MLSPVTVVLHVSTPLTVHHEGVGAGDGTGVGGMVGAGVGTSEHVMRTRKSPTSSASDDSTSTHRSSVPWWS